MVFQKHQLAICLTIAIFISSDLLRAQSYSAEFSDSSYDILQESNGVTNALAQLSVNKISGSAELVLGGNFPTISLLNLQIGHKGGNELGIDGDVVPFESVTFDLGNNVSDEHWDQVVAETFVTYMPNNFANQNTKSLTNTLPNLMMLTPIQYTSNKNVQVQGFSIKELKKFAPSVLVEEDHDFDPILKTFKIKKTEAGINYNAFIPLLVKAIQEQEVTIRNLTAEINQLKNSINK